VSLVEGLFGKLIAIIYTFLTIYEVAIPVDTTSFLGVIIYQASA